MHDERCAESRMGHDGQQRAPNQNHQAAGERDRAGSVQGRLGGERMTFDQLAGEFERDQFAGLAENTVKSHRAYLRHLKAFFGLSRLSQLPRPHSALADRTPKESASVWPCNFPLSSPQRKRPRTSPRRRFVLKGSSELLYGAAGRKNRPEEHPRVPGFKFMAVSKCGAGQNGKCADSQVSQKRGSFRW